MVPLTADFTLCPATTIVATKPFRPAPPVANFALCIASS
uniref:Uncharacterized protein n=1 Tax=Setaria italica TaxID=4555 RepID=K3ZGQ5_SETIT